MSTPEAIEESGEQVAPTDLTRFKLDLLRVIERDGAIYGLGIKDAIEEDYGREINHGRMYPNLDDLVNYGLVEKGQRDRRTNEYRLTTRGQAVLEARRNWLVADETSDTQPTTIADGGQR
jgi:DNA-binding PadR family transcriptional regulator